jgi:hypothetical protein
LSGGIPTPVGQDLEDPRRIEGDRGERLGQLDRQRDVLSPGLTLERLDRLHDDLLGLPDLAMHRERPGLDAGDVEQVADQAVHATARPLDALRERDDALAALPGRRLMGDQAGEAHHGA